MSLLPLSKANPEFEKYLDQSDQLMDLLSFAVSEDYFLARRRMGQALVVDEEVEMELEYEYDEEEEDE